MANPQPEYPWRCSAVSSPFPKLGGWEGLSSIEVSPSSTTWCVLSEGEKKWENNKTLAAEQGHGVTAWGQSTVLLGNSRREIPTVSQLSRKAGGDCCIGHEARQAVESEVFQSISLDFFASKASKTGVTPPFGRIFWK